MESRSFPAAFRAGRAAILRAGLLRAGDFAFAFAFAFALRAAMPSLPFDPRVSIYPIGGSLSTGYSSTPNVGGKVRPSTDRSV